MIEWNNTRYAEPLELARSQGDPLDLASTNERLYNTVFPGFNNVVRYIGVYSALCWMAVQVQRHLASAQGLTSTAAEELQLLAMEKMELALLWANGLEAELAGKTRPFTEGGAVQRLTMDQWDMNARLMSAPQYLPSLTNGLKFLNDHWVCTDRGQILAQAFEGKLGAPQAHRWLRDVTCLEATAVQVERARPALSVLTPPSAEEQQAFLTSFFPEDPHATGEIRDPRDALRWCSLHLVLHTVAQLDEGDNDQGEQAIRAAMTSGTTPSARSVIQPGLEKCQAIWAVLQLRLLQRMALETLLAFVIAWVRAHDRSGRRTIDCADAIGVAVADSFAEAGLATVGDLHASLVRSQGDHATLSLAATATGEDAPDVFFYLEQLERLRAAKWQDGPGGWLRLAVTGLAVCAVETGNFIRRELQHAEALRSIAAERTSLTALHTSFKRFQNQSLSSWTRELVMDWVFSRYGEVASQRAVVKGGKLRFDFIEGEYGLELGPPRSGPFRATWQTDKLYTALVLLQQCGLVRVDATSWQLTTAGRRRVQRYTDAPSHQQGLIGIN